MHPIIEDVLARQKASGFADFTGTTISVRLPMRDRFIDMLVRPAVAGQKHVDDVKVRVHAQNRVELEVSTSAIPLTRTVNLELLVHPELVFAPTPRVRLDVQRTGTASLLLKFARPFVSSALPPEATWVDETIWVDLDTALRRRDLGDVVPFIKSGRFTSEEGCLWIDLGLAIP